jgi:hypothetical protein
MQTFKRRTNVIKPDEVKNQSPSRTCIGSKGSNEWTWAKIQIGLLNLVYNMKRLLQLLKRDANVVKRDLINHHRKDAPIVA